MYPIKLGQILQMTCYFEYRMQNQHKIILLSSKSWVKYTLTIKKFDTNGLVHASDVWKSSSFILWH